VKYGDSATEWDSFVARPFLLFRDRQFTKVFKVARMFVCDFPESFSIIQIFSLKIRVFCGEIVFYFPENIASFDIFSLRRTPNETEQV